MGLSLPTHASATRRPYTARPGNVRPPAVTKFARPADPMSLTDEEWRDFLFIRSNPKGVHFERWRHINGCARFFNAARETVGDKFLATYKAGEPRPDADALLASPTGDAK